MSELKAIRRDGIPHALEKAERYRLLNDPRKPRASAATSSFGGQLVF